MIQLVHDLDDVRKAMKRTTVYFVLLLMSVCINSTRAIDGVRDNIILLSVTGVFFLVVFGLRHFFLYKENKILDRMVQLYDEELGNK